MSNRSRKPPIRIWLSFWTLLLPAACLFILNSAWLLSEAYDAHARQLIQSGRFDSGPLNAAGLSSYLSSGSAAHHLHYANILASYRMSDLASAEFNRALKISPADPGIWQAYVHFKLFIGQHDQELEHAVLRVYQLAPNDFGLHVDNADLAMQHWKEVSQPIKEQWAVSVERVVRHWSMTLFLQAVLQNRQEEILCRDSMFKHLNIQWWCKPALYARTICFAPTRNAKQTAWCRKIGLIPGTVN